MSYHSYYAPNRHYPITTPYRSTSFAITPHRSSSSHREDQHHHRSSSRKNRHDSTHYYPHGYPAVVYNAGPGSNTLVYGPPTAPPPPTRHYCCAPHYPTQAPPPPPPAYPDIAPCQRCHDIRELSYGLCMYCNDYRRGAYPAPPYGSGSLPSGQYYPRDYYRRSGGGLAYPGERRRLTYHR